MNFIYKTLFIIFIFSLISCTEKKDEKNDINDDNGNVDTENSEEFDNESGDNEENQDEEEPTGQFIGEPHGISFGDTAGDMTIPLETGDWKFSENRSFDENYIFIFYRPSNSESRTVWQTDMIRMFENSPGNTHYFFLTEGTAEVYQERIAQLKENIKTSTEMSGNLKILSNIHIAAKPVREFDSWLSLWLDKYPDYFLGIDRFQKIRKGGSFHSWQSSSFDPRFNFLYKEGELYNFEYDLYSFMDKNKDSMTVIKGIENIPFEKEGWVKDIYFTAKFPELSEKGELYIYLEQICESQKSCEWDRLQHLYLCENTDSENCTIEIGRWITTYGRSGKWITDISPLAPFFKTSKEYKFRFTVTGDNYINNLDFLFIEKNNALLPEGIIPLYLGNTQFDENYNSNFEELEIAIPQGAKKVEILAYITGHGNGSEAENCAEFCKFESVVYVNGTPYKTKFDNAGTSAGCFNLVSQGVVPNQYGSWPFGRAGWCPGQDVKLIRIDVTEKIKPGQPNIIHFQSFLNGETYIPVITDSSGYRAEIPLASYAVYW